MIVLIHVIMQANKITVMPILSGQSEESELRRPLGTYRQYRHSRHGNSDSGEPKEALHVHWQAAYDRP